MRLSGLRIWLHMVPAGYNPSTFRYERAILSRQHFPGVAAAGSNSVGSEAKGIQAYVIKIPIALEASPSLSLEHENVITSPTANSIVYWS